MYEKLTIYLVCLSDSQFISVYSIAKLHFTCIDYVIVKTRFKINIGTQ